MSAGLNVVALIFAFNCLGKVCIFWENTKDMVLFDFNFSVYFLLLSLTSMNNFPAAG